MKGWVKEPHEIFVGIADDALLFFVPEDGNCHSPVIPGFGRLVGFTKKFKSVDRICGMACPFAKGPAAIITDWIDYGHADQVLELFETSDDDGAMRPRACPGNVKMITPAYGRISRTSIWSDPVTKRVLLAFKFTCLILFIRKLRGSHKEESLCGWQIANRERS